MPEPSQLTAIRKARCPKCRQGAMFVYPLRNLTRFSQMNTHCPVCKLRFEVEPGFFIGAMYVSYGMSLGIFAVVSTFIYFIFNNPAFHFYIIGIPLVVLILLPVMYRYSRVLFLHLFGGIKYDIRDRTTI